MRNLFKFKLLITVAVIILSGKISKAQCPVTIVSVTTTAATCNGVSDGTITVTLSGGFPPYSYFVALGGFNQTFNSNNTTFTFTGLQAATNYLISVDGDADGNINTAGGCGGAFQTNIAITEPTALNVSTTSTPVLCPGQTSGTATVSISGGTPGYTISWNTTPAQSTPTISNLGAGSYTATVTDQNNCTAQSTTSVAVTNPTVITPTVTNVLCNGGSTGSISTVITGGTQPFGFSWNTTPVQTTQNATNLAAGTYTLTVTDANNCVQTSTSTVTQPTPITIVLTQTNVSCNGGSNGSITAVVQGGTPNYSFSWNSTPVQTTQNAFNLPAGTYTLTVTDANGCIRTSSRTITQPQALTASTTFTPILCHGASTGTATATPSGGTPQYTHSWNTVPVQSTATATNLAAGTYIDQITDANGCTFNASVTVTQSQAIVLIPTQTNVTCFGGNNGTATVLASGGTAPLSLSWNTVPVQTGAIATNLTAGTYIVTATDANNCTRTASVTITQPAQINVTTAGQNASCNGTCNGTATSSVSGGVSPYTFSWNTTPVQTTLGLTNLCAGTYILTVTDNSGCTATSTRIVTQPQAINVTATATNTPCSGVCTGTATAVASGGTGQLSFSWNTTPAQTTATATALCSGPYIVTITDGSGCTNTANANVNNTSSLSLNATATSPICNGACNGSITTTTSGGTSPITYSWLPNVSSGPNASNLCAGSYTITATDVNGCSFSQTVVLTQPAAVQISVAVTNLACNAVCNGTATSTVTGGQGPFTYLWTPNVSTGPNAANLCAGTYQVRVTDANGCQAITNATISQPLPFNFNATNTPPTCDGLCNGSVTTALTGGTSPYSYSWSPIGSNAPSINNLCDGSYTLTVTDASNCTSTNTFNVVAPAPISISSTATNASCGLCDATASIIPSGGTAPYSFLWSDAQSTANAINLCAGVYSVEITDFNGCTFNGFVPITNSQGVTNANLTTTPASCFGVCDGSASVAPQGGTQPYTFLWIPGGQTTSSVSGLCAGSNFVQISDANNCILTQAVNITEPTAIDPNSVIGTAACGACDGTINLSPSGGTGPYTFSWLPNVSSGSSASNLCAGAYQVTITDATNCSQTFTLNVNSTNGLSLTVNSSDPTCNGGNNGTASVTATGGTPSYTFLWTPGGQNTPTISNLSAGTYSVQVTDQSGCSITQPFTINDPTAVGLSLVVVTDPLCANTCNGSATVIPSGGILPYSFGWVPGGSTSPTATNLCAGTYTVTISDANGCSKDTSVTLTAPSPLVATTTATNPTCGGSSGCNGTATASASGGVGPYTFSWNTSPIQNTATADSLCAGTYTVTVTDANGCTTTATVTITQPQIININFTNVTNLSCGGVCNGTATALATGGVPFPGGTYTYSWNNPSNSTTQTVNNLCAGTWTVTVTDANNCSQTDSVTINSPSAISLSTLATDVTCFGLCNGQATVNIDSGGTAPFTITWNDPSQQGGATAFGLCPGTYTVTVTDASNCSANAQVSISQPQLLLVNVITTNTQCGNICSGSANATVFGGTPSYTYNWNNGQTTPQADSLCAGINYVTVTDSNGCNVTQNVPINSNGNIQTTVIGTDVSCSTSCDGSASVFASGGSNNFTYLWLNNGDITSTTTGICDGTYYVQVSDTAGCSAIDSVTINGSQFVANEVIVNSSGCGICNGSITINPTGGQAPYTFFWSNGDGGNVTSNLCAGLYTVAITDALGCIQNNTFSIINDNTDLSVFASSAGISCFSNTNGAATATVTGGTGPYTYIWNTVPQQSTQTATGLPSGIYFVSVTDANGCVSSSTITLNEPSGLIASQPNVIDPACSSNCNGEITFTVAGGTLPYTFAWLPNVASTSSTATGLCAGTYTGIVTDANGCQLSQTSTLNLPPPVTTSIAVVNSSCGNSCNGVATVFVQGGLPPYTFSWSSGGASASEDSLCAGVYIVTVTDAGGCIYTDTATITAPPALSLTTTTVDVSCTSACNGSATVFVSGGTIPFSYSWNDFNNQTTQTALSLCVGSYRVTVTDHNGCQDTISVVITDNNALHANISNPINCTCYGGCNGSATGNGVGGQQPYTYQWNDDLLQTTQTATNLCAGTYICFVFDVNGCVDADTVIITQPTQVVVTATSVNATCGNICNGTGFGQAAGGTPPYTYIWNDNNLTVGQSVSDLCAGIYTIVATDANGCNSLAQTPILQPSNIEITGTTTNAVCNNTLNGGVDINVSGGTPSVLNGYTYSWQPGGFTTQDLSNALSGLYVVTVLDSNACVFTDSFTVYANIYVNADAGADSSVCLGDSIKLEGIGGLTYNWQPSTQISGSNLVANITGQIDSTTTFTLIVELAGCSDTDQVVITATLPDSINAGTDQSMLAGQAVFLNASGSDNYIWAPTVGLSDPTSPTTQASPDSTVIYVVYSKSANGCIGWDSVTVEVVPGVNFPDGITPNGDGHNDTWLIDNLNLYPENSVEIFNRWGESIFYSQGYDTPWDGKFKGKDLPVGTYYYVIDLHNEQKALTGPITIVR